MSRSLRYYQRRNETTSKFLIHSSPISQNKSFLHIFQQFRTHFSHLTMRATRPSLLQLLNLINRLILVEKIIKHNILEGD
jgi:hypothetical protein